MKKVVGLCIFLAIIFSAIVSRCVFAHGPGDGVTIAELTSPRGIEHALGPRFTITWSDGDELTASPAATIEIFYTSRNTPPFIPGHVPAELTGQTIAMGVSVHDRANSFVWDTTSIPSGAYWIWTRVDDPEAPSSKEKSISFSPGVVIVAHADDPLSPAVVLVAPSDPFLWPPSDTIELEYLAFDPDGSAEVRIDARPSFDPSPGMVTIADHLPADSSGRFVWETKGLPEGEWTLRATISDKRGLSFSAYDRYFRFVNHLEPVGESDTGCRGVRAFGASATTMIDVVLLAFVALLLGRRIAK